MKDYEVNGKVVEITLESGKVVKCATEWVKNTMKSLETDLEDVLLMWLEDNDYLVNEEQEELDKKAKGQFKIVNQSEDKPKKKTQKERVAKENPTKELIIAKITEMLGTLQGVDNILVENKAKLVTFSLNGEDFKVDLVQKRKPKAK